MTATPDRPLPCLPAAELDTFRTVERRAVLRGVDCGPDAAAELLEVVRRLAHQATVLETLAQRAAHAGEQIDPDAVFALLGAIADPEPSPQAVPDPVRGDPALEYGVEYTVDGETFVGAAFMLAGARWAVRQFDGWPGYSARVMQRPISEWQPVVDEPDTRPVL